MTELEKIAYAKSFIDKLANGINPLDDTLIPDTDIVNNVRLSRCFFYVSDILRQVYENGGVTVPKSSSKIEFCATVEELEKFEFSKNPIPVSEISKRINAALGNENMQKISPMQINRWLLDIGMLKTHDFGGKRISKIPTEDGNAIGITCEIHTGKFGEYHISVYNEDAQHFILDNLDAVCATKIKKPNNTLSEGKIIGELYKLPWK